MVTGTCCSMHLDMSLLGDGCVEALLMPSWEA